MVGLEEGVSWDDGRAPSERGPVLSLYVPPALSHPTLRFLSLFSHLSDEVSHTPLLLRLKSFL